MSAPLTQRVICAMYLNGCGPSDQPGQRTFAWSVSAVLVSALNVAA